MTFQAWKMVLLNSMTFQEEWTPWIWCVANIDVFHQKQLTTLSAFLSNFIKKVQVLVCPQSESITTHCTLLATYLHCFL